MSDNKSQLSIIFSIKHEASKEIARQVPRDIFSAARRVSSGPVAHPVMIHELERKIRFNIELFAMMEDMHAERFKIISSAIA
jgi:hypothetical protein